MKRMFWTAVLIAITLTGGWTLYVGAQELQNQIGFGADSEPRAPRFQFIEHFFLNQGEPYEVFLRIDRQTGQSWRYHATQTMWSMIEESSERDPQGGFHDRYELMSHVYRNPQGIQLERMLRVDYQSGRSWTYDPMASRWDEIAVEGTASNGQQSSARTARSDVPPENANRSANE
jgi:hypothetical protein